MLKPQGESYPTLDVWMEEWQAEPGHHSFDYALTERSHTKSRKATKAARTITIDGERITCWRHLKWGKSDKLTRTLRVHFWENPKDMSIWVGHIGQHLPT